MTQGGSWRLFLTTSSARHCRGQTNHAIFWGRMHTCVQRSQATGSHVAWAFADRKHSHRLAAIVLKHSQRIVPPQVNTTLGLLVFTSLKHSDNVECTASCRNTAQGSKASYSLILGHSHAAAAPYVRILVAKMYNWPTAERQNPHTCATRGLLLNVLQLYAQ